MSIRDPKVFRDIFTSFVIDGIVPNAILVNGTRYELMIMHDTHPQRFAIKGVHDLLNSIVEPCD